ncbi:hypothetical protein VUR80DRAFT_3616 [Thermomyces stellatus]
MVLPSERLGIRRVAGCSRPNEGWWRSRPLFRGGETSIGLSGGRTSAVGSWREERGVFTDIGPARLTRWLSAPGDGRLQARVQRRRITCHRYTQGGTERRRKFTLTAYTVGRPDDGNSRPMFPSKHIAMPLLHINCLGQRLSGLPQTQQWIRTFVLPHLTAQNRTLPRPLTAAPLSLLVGSVPGGIGA